MIEETWFLRIEDLLRIAERIVGPHAVSDLGLMESAAQRPKTTVFGQPAYPTIELQAAALAHSLARNHALLDGNKRLAWTGMRIFCELNGVSLLYTVDEAEELIVGIAVGQLDVPHIAEWIARHRSA